jgi:predicted PurR-regulated permease PerM
VNAVATDRWIRLTIGVALAAASVYLAYQLRFVLVTVVLAAMFAYALLPLVEWAARVQIARQAIPRVGAVGCVFLLTIGTTLAAGYLAAAPVGDQARRAAENLGEYRDSLSVSLSLARASLNAHLPPALQRALDDAIDQSGGMLVSMFGHIMRTTAEWASHVVEILLIPVLAFYFLVELPVLKEELLGFLPAAARRPVMRAATHLDRILAAYVRGQLVLMCLSAVVVWAGLTVMGVRLALVLGIVAGLTRAIPIVGPVLGAVPIVSVVFLESLEAAVAALLFFVALQIIESKVILPQVIGHHLQLRAATILIALLIGNALLGLVGMFLAPPAAAFLLSFLRLSYQQAKAEHIPLRNPG